MHYTTVWRFTYARRAVCFIFSSEKNLCPTKEIMKFTCPFDAVRFSVEKMCGSFTCLQKFTSHKKKSCSPLVRLMQCGFQSKSSAVFFLVFKNLRPTKKKTMQFSYPSDAVRFFVRCSAVFSRMKYPR